MFAGDKRILMIAGGLRRLKSLQIAGYELYVETGAACPHVYKEGSAILR